MQNYRGQILEVDAEGIIETIILERGRNKSRNRQFSDNVRRNNRSSISRSKSG